MKNKILEILKDNRDEFTSGEKISEELNITRAGVWKNISKLREEGYVIDSITKMGYKLISTADILSKEELGEYLSTEFIGKNIEYFSTINSTNQKAKEDAFNLEDGSVLIAEEQTGGRGRLGRQWISPDGKGIWMSIVLKPELDPYKVSKITLIGVVAVFNALKNIGIDSQIKWPNDILINGKKVGGILTEMSSELNMIDYIIMGIGINANLDKEDFPQDLKNKGTSLKIEIKREINRKELTAKILNELEKLYIEFKENGDIGEIIPILRENTITLGKEILVIRGKTERIGKAIDIDEQGELVVEFQSGRENIISGQVSIRTQNGYI